MTSIQTYCPGFVETRLVLARNAVRGSGHGDMARGSAHDDMALARRLAR